MNSWDAYLGRFSYNPPMNLYAWRQILEDTYKIKTFFFIASGSGGDIEGVLPTYVTKSIRGRKKLYSLRYGCVADSSDIQNELFLHMISFCRRNGIESALVTSGNRRVDTDLGELIKKTVIIDLAQDAESTWRSLRDKTRNMIRKAVRSELAAEKGFCNLKEFYKVYVSSMLRKGLPAHSYTFFKNIAEKMKDKTELIVAKKDNRVIAGILILFSKDIAIYPFQSSLESHRKFAPNDFLIWETMKLCLDNGIGLLDMGESREGGTVYRFKTNFGGRPSDIYYYSTPNPGRIGKEKKESQGASLKRAILSISPSLLGKNVAHWIKRSERII